ncbi:MAG: hypothetical protein OSB43_15625 [Nocardioides sp.]|uniref:hypothetical protein n=1 Tax=Nocardioides sp. TaxID=35761 RepID=UPI0023988F4A|nr:hypothetical protein [Nocardioides sp.]MDE0777706.1 hypothetical protein [Nocardioides sp.]
MVHLKTHAEDVGVTVDIVISDESLLGAGHEPATLPDVPGCVIPAQIARELIAHALRAETISFTRTPSNAGGQTSEDNTQGLCQACNHAKQADGWTQHVIDDESGRHTVQTTTPTGHHHRSRAPAPPTPARAPTARPRPAVASYRPAFDLDYVAAA